MEIRAKGKAAANRGEMIEIATNGQWRENRKEKHAKDAKYGWYKYDTRFAIPVKDVNNTVQSYKQYDASLIIRHGTDGKLYLYDVMNMKQNMTSLRSFHSETGISYKLERGQNNTTNISQNISGVNNSIYESGKKDGTQYSITTDRNYDYSKPFGEQIEDWKAGRFPKNDTFVLGATPMLYQQIGFSNIPLTMDQTHVDYAINGTKNEDHVLGETLLKSLPELLENPVAIVESSSRPGDSVVVIIDKTVNGKPMMAAINIDSGGKINDVEIDSNHLVSAQGRKNTISKLLKDAVQKEIDGDVGIYYWNKKEAQLLLGKAGVRFPRWPAQDSGLVHSIFDSGSPVNREYITQTESRQFKKWFKNSKAVNKAGEPMVLYHYTDAEFSEFDPNRSGSNQGQTQTS